MDKSQKEMEIALRKQKFEYDTLLIEKKERIFQLVKENEELKESLEKYKAKEQEISLALVTAIEKAKEIEKLSITRFQNRIKKLKQLEVKILAFYNALAKKYPLDTALEETKKFLIRLDQVLAQEFFSERTKALKEARGLRESVPFSFDSIPPSESGFDFYEANHPDQSIEEILKDIFVEEEKSSTDENMGGK